MNDRITCIMCGHTFDPQAHAACKSCPLHSGCQLVCCPACGYQLINPQRSGLARLFMRWLPSGSTDQRSKPEGHST